MLLALLGVEKPHVGFLNSEVRGSNKLAISSQNADITNLGGSIHALFVIREKVEAVS